MKQKKIYHLKSFQRRRYWKRRRIIQKILSGKTEKEQKNRQGEKENRHFAMLKWIVIGSIITILLIMTGVVLCRRKKDSAKEEQADEE